MGNTNLIIMPNFRIKSDRIVRFAVDKDDVGGVEVFEKYSLTSESPLFHLFSQHSTNIFLSKIKIPPEIVYNLLIVLHDDDIADIFVNDFKEEAWVKPTRNVAKGELVYKKDIADISHIRFPDINITPSDSIIYCKRHGWRFCLYFDFTRNIKKEKMEKDLGKLAKELLLKNSFDEEKYKLDKALDNNVDALIFTEGKTDWKHLKKAFDENDIDLKINFEESEEDRGGKYLLQMCEYISKIPQQMKIIFIFDREDNYIINKLIKKTKPDLAFQNWGNNVFSMMLPIPEHRATNKEITIELYYTDEELKTLDKNGRRLFLNSEFDKKSGRHLDIDCNCLELNKIKLSELEIIDSKVYNRKRENIALPKSDFAKYVLNGEKGFDNFDFSNFRPIFNVIEKIISK